MRTILKRIKGAHGRLCCASRFTGSYIAAALGFFAYKFDKRSTMCGSFKGMDFCFRSADVEALNEVLVDQEYSFLSDFLVQHKKPVILDIGHHIGTFSLWAFSQNRQAFIMALEADPCTFEVACRNAALGREKGLEWQVLHKAAWSADEGVSFSCDGDTMGHKVSQSGAFTVSGISLKSTLSMTGGSVDLMKLDIEGAEEAFLGAHREMLKDIGSIVIELHPEYCSQENVMNILKASYDKIVPLKKRENEKPLLWCYREGQEGVL